MWNEKWGRVVVIGTLAVWACGKGDGPARDREKEPAPSAETHDGSITTITQIHEFDASHIFCQRTEVAYHYEVAELLTPEGQDSGLLLVGYDNLLNYFSHIVRRPQETVDDWCAWALTGLDTEIRQLTNAAREGLVWSRYKFDAGCDFAEGEGEWPIQDQMTVYEPWAFGSRTAGGKFYLYELEPTAELTQTLGTRPAYDYQPIDFQVGYGASNRQATCRIRWGG
jgi:hypothetical protein